MINHIIVLVVLTIFGSSQSFDYSKRDLCDPGRRHTMMMYPVAGPSQACGKVINRGLKPGKIKEIVHLHNELRDRVAQGLETSGINGPQPPATNMRHLKWDKELAEIAQRWADQCNFRHDTCRNVERYPWVGQNLWISTYVGMEADVLGSVYSWYDEVKDFDSNNVDYYNPHDIPHLQTGHYSQLVWAETTTIGCGSINHEWGITKRVYLVCNYGPGGNIQRTKMYERGQPSNFPVQPVDQQPSDSAIEPGRSRPSNNFKNNKIGSFKKWIEALMNGGHLKL